MVHWFLDVTEEDAAPHLGKENINEWFTPAFQKVIVNRYKVLYQSKEGRERESSSMWFM